MRVSSAHVTTHTSYEGIMINRLALEIELEEFLRRFTDSIDRIYGRGLAATLATDVRQSTLWATVIRMFEYGVEGRTFDGLGDGDGTLDPDAQDAMLFLTGLHGLTAFLGEDEVPVPHKAIRVVEMACTRHVLDGGERFYAMDEDAQWSDCLSIAEIALLANMDVKSVRNATSEKAADRLNTQLIGKRSQVSLEEARRWLAGRKGFVPSSKTPIQTTSSHISLSANTFELLTAQAQANGVDVETLILALLGQVNA